MAEQKDTSATEKIFNSDVIWKVCIVIVFGAIMYRDVELLKSDNAAYKQDLADLRSRVSQLSGKMGGMESQKEICTKVLDVFLRDRE